MARPSFRFKWVAVLSVIVFFTVSLVRIMDITRMGKTVLTGTQRPSARGQNYAKRIDKFEVPATKATKTNAFDVGLDGKNKTFKLKANNGKVFITIGIATVCRGNVSYIEDTLMSLLLPLRPDQLKTLVVVVLLSDPKQSCRQIIENNINMIFERFIRQNVLQIIRAPDDLYPSFQTLKQTFNDRMERVKWRSKQNLDYAYLMFYCQDKSEYYLHLEDDVVAASSYLQNIEQYIPSVKKEWAVLEFSTLGSIGKLFHSRDVEKMANILRSFYNEQPIDYLFSHYRKLMLQTERIIHIPTLFQHVGYRSSLPNLTRDVSDAFFSSYTKHYQGDNPPALVYTTMPAWKNYKPENPYSLSESSVYWTRNPVPGGTYTVVFTDAYIVTRIVILSGLNNRHSDKLWVGMVETGTTVVPTTHRDVSCSNLEKVGIFKNGTIDVDISNVTRKTKCIKITVTKRLDKWLVIREIAVFLKH